MTNAAYFSNLPDPAFRREFYADVVTKRLFAWIIDSVLILVLCAIIIPFTIFTALFFLPFLYLVVGFAYRTVTLASRSATWGMRLMSIEFRTHRGERFDMSMAALHTAGYSLSISIFPLQLISVILMLTAPRGQGLSDIVLGTAAINRTARA